MEITVTTCHIMLQDHDQICRQASSSRATTHRKLDFSLSSIPQSLNFCTTCADVRDWDSGDKIPGHSTKRITHTTQITGRWLRDGEVIMIHITPSAADIAAMQD